MSLVKVQGNVSGTGVFTVAAPNSNTDRTLTLPDTSGTLVAPSSEGTAGQVLTSNGAGSSPTFQNLPAGGVTSLNGQTGAITNTDLYAIGSYVIGRPANSTAYSVNTTVAGSSLYATSTANNTYSGGFTTNSGAVLINTGTWRCVSPAFGSGLNAWAGLWVRIS